MPVIEKPQDRGPLFGEGVQVVFGPRLVQLLREKRDRDRRSASAAPTDEDRDSYSVRRTSLLCC